MSSSRLFKLGLFFLAAFGMLAYFTLFLYDQQWFGDQTVFRVEFPEANGLRVGDGVRVSGMRIGRVTRMSFDPNVAPERRISVSLSLETPIILREGYQIQIGETTLLGGRNIDIMTGPPEADPLAITEDTILVGTLDPSPLAALSAVGNLVTDNREFVRSILENFDAVMAGVRAGDGTIGRLISDKELGDKVGTAVDDISVVAGDLRAGKGTLGKLIMNEEVYQEILAAVRLLTQSLEDYREAAPVSTFTSVLFGAF